MEKLDSLSEIKRELKKKSDPHKAQVYQGFFKTSPGEYGEGDVFLGIPVPEVRRVIKKYSSIQIEDSIELLKSKYHEERLAGVLILVNKYNIGNTEIKKEVYNFYLSIIKYINNWDLVDISAYKILGPELINEDKSILYKLSESSNIWERRISILTTFYFIKNKKYEDTLKIAELLIQDNHDLIHKAVGWMLREVGNRDFNTLDNFLKTKYTSMPRTMLRYAIEKFPEEKRRAYLRGMI